MVSNPSDPTADLEGAIDVFTAALEHDMAEAAKLRLEIKALDAKKDVLDKRIMDACFFQGKTCHVIPGWKANIENRWTKTIKREKLIARGVAVDIIDEATTTTGSEPFVKFYALKDDGTATE